MRLAFGQIYNFVFHNRQSAIDQGDLLMLNHVYVNIHVYACVCLQILIFIVDDLRYIPKQGCIQNLVKHVRWSVVKKP